MLTRVEDAKYPPAQIQTHDSINPQLNDLTMRPQNLKGTVITLSR